MGIIEITTIATLLITEFLKGAISETAKKSIEGLFEMAKEKLSAKEDGRKALEALKTSPNDNSKQADFAKQLQMQLMEDKVFAQSVRGKLQPIIHNEEVSVFLNKIGAVDKIIQINNMYGDIEM